MIEARIANGTLNTIRRCSSHRSSYGAAAIRSPLRRAAPEFAAYYDKYKRSLGVTHLMAVAASEPGPLQELVLRSPQIQKALEILRKK